jgi:hypothetical protein
MNDLKNKRKIILEKIRDNEPLRKHFFQKLSITSNPFPWLDDLIDEGYFDQDKYTQPWEPSGYFENLSKLNYRENDQKTTEVIVEITNNYINLDFDERNSVVDYVFLKVIFNLPKEKIKADHIIFISKTLDSKWDSTLIQAELSEMVIPRLIEYKLNKLLLMLLKIILDFKKEPKKYYDDYVSIIDEFWLNKILNDNKPAIAELCALDASKVALKIISDISDEDKNQFNHASIPAIEDHPQTLFPEEYKIQLVHFVRDMFEYVHLNFPYSDEMRECTIFLAGSGKSIFKRFAIYIINLYYNELNDIFWGWADNPLDEIDLTHDIHRLLNLNLPKFDNDEDKIDRILEWINTDEYICEIEKEGADPSQIAYQKLKWLYPLKESENPKIQALIEECNQHYEGEIEHPDFHFWMGELEAIEPKDSEKLCEKTNSELADYLNDKYDTESMFDRSELSESFIKCVSDNTEKFTTDLDPFLDISRENQYNLLYGLYSVWRSEKTFECNEIFDFILKIITDKDFWKEDPDESGNYRYLVVSEIADFIEIGTKDDRYSFDKDLLPKAGDILLFLADNTESDLREMHDLTTSVLNSSLGKIFSAMIVYSMKCVRESEKFPDKIKASIEKRLSNPPIELSVTLGKYLPYLCALDKDWVKIHIKSIFPDEIEVWKPAFIGYLFYSSTIYTDIYNLLKNDGHYERAIYTDFEDHNINQRLIQHICTFYLKGDEDLDDPDSLISKLINSGDSEKISLFIHFILARKDTIALNQVKPLWSRIIHIFSEDEGTEHCGIVAKLARWLELVDEIDADILNWLIKSAKCMKSQTEMSIFIEKLANHVEKSPQEVGKIYLELLKKTPEHRKEHIMEIVEILFQKNETIVANYICNEYRLKGLDFLRDIHEKYNE